MSNTVKCKDGIFRTSDNPESFRTMEEIEYIDERSEEEINASFITLEDFEEWMDSQETSGAMATRAELQEPEGTFDNDDYSEEGRP